MLSEGTIWSPISFSACAGGGGGYGWIKGCVWYSPGSSSSLFSIWKGHCMPVEQAFDVGGLVWALHKRFGWSCESLHSTTRTWIPSPQDTEHWKKYN